MEIGKLIISSMTSSDVDEVVQIERKIFPTPWTTNMFISELNKKNNAYYLVAREDRLIGYGGINHLLDEAHITNLAISPEYQGRSIGKLLLILLIKKVIELNLDLVWLEVRTTNQKARRLYEKFNFFLVGKRKNYYQEQKEDALIYCLNSKDFQNLNSFLENEEELIRSKLKWELLDN